MNRPGSVRDGGGFTVRKETRTLRRLRHPQGDRGFTMVELMVVILIVAVLAAVAVPIYGKYIKNARLTEATGRMGEIITACKAYAQNNTDGDDNPLWPSGGGGLINLTAGDCFAYDITEGRGQIATSNPLTITATGQSRMAGITVSITVPDLSRNAEAPVVTGL